MLYEKTLDSVTEEETKKLNVANVTRCLLRVETLIILKKCTMRGELMNVIFVIKPLREKGG